MNNNHALIGSEVVNRIPLFRPLNRIVRYHHTRWRNGLGHYIEGERVPEESHLLFLLTGWMYFYCEYRTDHSAFCNKLVDIVAAGANILYKQGIFRPSERFPPMTISGPSWRPPIIAITLTRSPASITTPSLYNLRDIAELVSFIIDQFSQQTPWHSAAVGHIAGYLATKNRNERDASAESKVAGYCNISCLDHSPPSKRVVRQTTPGTRFILLKVLMIFLGGWPYKNGPAPLQLHEEILSQKPCYRGEPTGGPCAKWTESGREVAGAVKKK